MKDVVAPVTNPKTEIPTRKHQKKKAESFSTIPGGDRRNSAMKQYFKVKPVSNMVTLFLSFLLELWLLFFSKASVANSDKTNRSLPNLHVPHKGQWPKSCLNSQPSLRHLNLYPQLRTFL